MSGRDNPIQRVLVVTLDAYKFSTRARKSARAYSSAFDVAFVGLARAGRAGRWDLPGCFERDGILVRQLPVAQPWTAPTRVNQMRNLLCCYLPALVRFLVVAWRTPTDVVHVTGAPLALVGWLHVLRHSSRFVLDVQERPGAVTSEGSVTAIFSRFELRLLRWVARRVDVATVATPGDISAVEALGFRRAVLVRNAPFRDWRAEFEPVRRRPGDPLRAAVIGTVFEGRGYDLLLRAVALARRRSPVEVAIVGPGRADYLDSLRALASKLGVDSAVTFAGTVESSGVSEAYLSAHVGLVLYESNDAGNDGLSNKLLECVATGRPVVAGDLPENRRFVEENRVGWLTPLSEEGLAATLLEAARADIVPDLSRHCRALGDDWLNWDVEFQQVLCPIRDAVGAARAVRPMAAEEW